jgi:hypothetical protein
MNASQSPLQAPHLPFAIDASSVLTILFFIIFVVWVIYTLVAAYHWFRYSHRSWLAVPAVTAYVFGSLILIVYIATGVN